LLQPVGEQPGISEQELGADPALGIEWPKARTRVGFAECEIDEQHPTEFGHARRVQPHPLADERVVAGLEQRRMGRFATAGAAAAGAALLCLLHEVAG
jgi:hypothetical protein